MKFKGQIDVFTIPMALYIFMMLTANDVLIPSFLCTISIGLVIVSTIAYLAIVKKFVIKKTEYYVFFQYMLFVIFAVIAIGYSPNKKIINDSSYLLYITLIMIFCFCTLIDSYEKVIFLLKVYVWGTAALFFILCGTGNLITNNGERLGSSFTNNPNTFALFMLISYFFASWLVIYYEKKINQRVLYGLVLIFSIITIFLSGARKVIFACAIFTFIMILLKTNKKGKRRIVKNVIIAIGVLIILWQIMIKVPVIYDIVGKRMESLIMQFMGKEKVVSQSSSYLRAVYRRLAIKGWLQSPIWGNGYDSFRFYNTIVTGHNAYSHNNFTELLYDLGVVGFLLYYSRYFSILRIEKKTKEYGIKIFTISSMVGLLICEYGQVDYNLVVVSFFLFILYRLNTLKGKTEQN